MNLIYFDSIQSILILALLLYVGEFLSKKLKGMLPSVLVSGIIAVALVWSGIIPRDIVDRSGFLSILSFCVMMIILDMGATTNFKELWANRNIVLLAASCLVFQIAVLLFTVGGAFGLNTALAGLPGGTSTAMIIQEKARELGYYEFVALSVLLIAVQNMVGTPIVFICVKKEVRERRKEGWGSGSSASMMGKVTGTAASPYRSLLILAFGAWIASRFEMLTGFSRYAFSLITGVILAELGILKKSDMVNSQSRGFVFFVLMSMVLAGFCSSEKWMFREMFIPLVSILAVDVAAIFLFCLLTFKWFHLSKNMAIAVGMEILVGFPLNIMLTQDIAELTTDDEEEREKIMSNIGTSLVIGGFTSLTTLSVLFASLLINYMK